MSHTPGPWEIASIESGCDEVEDAANARLYEELYEELIELFSDHRSPREGTR